jgi:hypothetical protein
MSTSRNLSSYIALGASRRALISSEFPDAGAYIHAVDTIVQLVYWMPLEVKL